MTNDAVTGPVPPVDEAVRVLERMRAGLYDPWTGAATPETDALDVAIAAVRDAERYKAALAHYAIKTNWDVPMMSSGKCKTEFLKPHHGYDIAREALEAK